MPKGKFLEEVRKNWDALYNDNILKKKFLRTLKQTRSPLAAIWSYGSNLQYYNMVDVHLVGEGTNECIHSFHVNLI